MTSCAQQECAGRAVTRGYCNAHYQAARRRGDFTSTACSVNGCEGPGFQRGLCGLHYDRKRKTGEVGGPERLTRLPGAAHVRRDGLKQCLRCDKWLPESEYHKLNRNIPGADDGLAQKCRQCSRELKRLSNWGLSGDQIECLVFEQGGCAICKRTDPGVKGWCVDHDHKCCPGQTSCGRCLRGILCGTCNSAIGLLRENVDTLSNAIDYLYEWRVNLEAV